MPESRQSQTQKQLPEHRMVHCKSAQHEKSCRKAHIAADAMCIPPRIFICRRPWQPKTKMTITGKLWCSVSIYQYQKQHHGKLQFIFYSFL